MWHVDLLLDPGSSGSRDHAAAWLPGGMQPDAEVYSIVIDDLNLDAFPDSDLIPLAHTAPPTPVGHSVIGTELAARTPSRYKKLSGRTLAATYAFPSRQTMVATARSAIGWGDLPSQTSLRFGQAAGVHRRLKVPTRLPSDRQTNFVPVGVCFDLDLVPLSANDIQGCSCAALFKEHRSAYLVPYLLPTADDFWVVVRKLAAWVKRVLRAELMYLFVHSDPRCPPGGPVVRHGRREVAPRRDRNRVPPEAGEYACSPPTTKRSLFKHCSGRNTDQTLF